MHYVYIHVRLCKTSNMRKVASRTFSPKEILGVDLRAKERAKKRPRCSRVAGSLRRPIWRLAKSRNTDATQVPGQRRKMSIARRAPSRAALPIERGRGQASPRGDA